MRRVDGPKHSLTLRDMHDDTTLTVVGSNQGDPYRETLTLTYERAAHGTFSNYEMLGSVELTNHEELQLRDLLNTRHPPR